MKEILFRRFVLLLVFVIHAVMKCEATFCIDHYNKLVKEIREHKNYCSDQVKNRSPCFCEAEASSLKERRRNYKILCQEGKLIFINLTFLFKILNTRKFWILNHFFLWSKNPIQISITIYTNIYGWVLMRLYITKVSNKGACKARRLGKGNSILIAHGHRET